MRKLDSPVGDPLNGKQPHTLLKNVTAPAAEAGQADPATSLDGLARRLKVRYLEQVRDHAPSARFLERVPISYARQHRLLGLAAEDGQPLPVVFVDPSAWDCLDVLGRWLKTPIEPVLAEEAEVIGAINAAYQQRTGQADALIQELDPRKDPVPALSRAWRAAPGAGGERTGGGKRQSLLPREQTVPGDCTGIVPAWWRG